ncbi:T9SS type A sorting domain-containing protein [Lacinutrix sp. MEBiC02404]
MKGFPKCDFKKYFLVIIIFLFALHSKGQDSRLGENVWYLQNVIVNGQNNYPPSNTEVASVSLAFFTGFDFETNVCNLLSGNLIFDDALSTFTFSELYQTLIVCDMQENSSFESLYFSNFYFANQSGAFTYNIVQLIDNTYTLTITTNNGDQAIYGSALLSTNKHIASKIKLFPNPVIHSLTIDKTKDLLNLKLTVYNVKGQRKLSHKIASSNTTNLNVSNLEPGIYFFVFETENGEIETKRIIKN